MPNDELTEQIHCSCMLDDELARKVEHGLTVEGCGELSRAYVQDDELAEEVNGSTGVPDNELAGETLRALTDLELGSRFSNALASSSSS